MQFTGTVTHALEVKSGEKKAGGTWTSQDFVMSDMAAQYPKSIVFTVWGDKIALIEGEQCTVHLEGKAEEYNGKWYNKLQAWKKEGSAAPAQAAAPSTGGTLSKKAPTAEQWAKCIATVDGDSQDPGNANIEKFKKAFELTDAQVAELQSKLLPF